MRWDDAENEGDEGGAESGAAIFLREIRGIARIRLLRGLGSDAWQFRLNGEEKKIA